MSTQEELSSIEADVKGCLGRHIRIVFASSCFMAIVFSVRIRFLYHYVVSSECIDWYSTSFDSKHSDLSWPPSGMDLVSPHLDWEVSCPALGRILVLSHLDWEDPVPFSCPVVEGFLVSSLLDWEDPDIPESPTETQFIHLVLNNSIFCTCVDGQQNKTR